MQTLSKPIKVNGRTISDVVSGFVNEATASNTKANGSTIGNAVMELRLLRTERMSFCIRYVFSIHYSQLSQNDNGLLKDFLIRFRLIS